MIPASAVENLDARSIWHRPGRAEWQIIGGIVALKIILFGFAAQAFSALADEPVADFRAALELWNRWDSIPYLEIAEHGYRATGDSINRLVLFPLFPWCVRALTWITRDYLVSGMVVSTVGVLIAAILLGRLTALDHDRSTSSGAIWFMVIFPTAFFLQIAYAEAMFLALAIGAFIAARKDQWILAGIFGALASMTRLNGVLLAPALGIEAFLQLAATRRWNWRWLALGLIPLGFGVYLWLNYSVSGNAFKFVQIQQEHFFKHFSWPWVGITARVRYICGHPPIDAVITGWQESLFIALGLVCTVISWFKLRPSYSVWMSLNWLLFTTAGFIICVPRYTLAMFPIFILFARASRHPIWFAALTAWSLLFLALFTGIFVQGLWVS